MQIEELGSTGVDFVDQLPLAIAQAQEGERVIGEEEGQPRLRSKQ